MLTSHSRSHGTPPKEPWEYGKAFTDVFRRAAELKYRLMPYVYAQAKDASQRGLPMLRALFIEFPDDPGSWLVEDEYLFGSDMLVAPLMQQSTTSRDVYLPPGTWIDYQTGKTYPAGWHAIEAGAVPVVVLVRQGAVIPYIALAQSTSQMDWSKLELVVFAGKSDQARGLVSLPADGTLHELSLRAAGGGRFALAADPLAGKVSWTIHAHDAAQMQR
jgi:alpha-D-xyloside xylohydrolase